MLTGSLAVASSTFASSVCSSIVFSNEVISWSGCSETGEWYSNERSSLTSFCLRWKLTSLLPAFLWRKVARSSSLFSAVRKLYGSGWA